MTYFAPLLAYGTEVDKTITAGQNLQAGDTDILCDNSTNPFSVGDHIFIVSVDSDEYQHLGEVTALRAGDTGISVSKALAGDYADGATVFSPASIQEFSVGHGFDIQRSYRTGVRTRNSRGGRIFATQIADARHVIDMSWRDRAVLSEFSAFLTWLATNRSNGRLAVTLVYWDHLDNQARCSKAYLLGRQVDDDFSDDLNIKINDRTYGTISLTWAVESLDGYATS